MNFDTFLEEKCNEYIDGEADSLILESSEERKRRFLYNWAMIPLTRAIDTLIITIKDSSSKTAQILRKISKNYADFVSWL